jgi:hypothetical protein
MSYQIKIGDIIKNDSFICKYGIVTDITAVSFYTQNYKVTTYKGPYIWDDVDTRFFHTLKVGDTIESTSAHLYKISHLSELKVALTSCAKEDFVQTCNFQELFYYFTAATIKHSSAYDNYDDSKCAHNFKPWPMDIFRAYCKYCGEPSPNN